MSASHYVFNHIPKTGGTSMYRILERSIGLLLSPHFSLNEDIDYEVNSKDYEKYMVIYGHIGVVWNDVLGPHRQWMTMLRDPVDRVLSQYYYWRNMISPSPHLPHVHAAQTMQIEEFIKSRDFMVVQGNDNAQTWFLADDLRRRFRKVPENDALELAKHNLRNRFAFVGIFEEYENSVKRLCDLLDLRCQKQPIPFENRTSGRKAVKDLPTGVITAIRERNTMDQALYEYAKTYCANGVDRKSDEAELLSVRVS